MDAESILKKIDQIRDLPTLPVIVVELNRMLQDRETVVEKLIETIEKDQAIVLKILKLVNSAFYGFRSQISSLHQAVVLLGFNTVRNAVLSVSIINAFKDANQLEGFNMNEFWQHSVAVAVTSKHLAKTTALGSADDSFVAGLLHDVGKIILFQFFGGLFEQVWKHMKRPAIWFWGRATPADKRRRRMNKNGLDRRTIIWIPASTRCSASMTKETFCRL